MKDKIFGILQRVGRSFMLPIAILPVAGLLLGIGGSFTNETMLETYGHQSCSLVHKGREGSESSAESRGEQQFGRWRHPSPLVMALCHKWLSRLANWLALGKVSTSLMSMANSASAPNLHSMPTAQ